MEEEKVKEIFKDLNLVKIEADPTKNLEQIIEDFLVSTYNFEKEHAKKISKKVIKDALIILTPLGNIEKKVPAGGIKKGSKIFLSEKFLEPEIKKNLQRLDEISKEKLKAIDLNPEEKKHLEDVLKEQIENILKTFFEVIEKDKKSEYTIIKRYAEEIDQKIKKIIETKKELGNNEINEIIAYLNGRAAYYQTLENAKMFAKLDSKSKNKMLVETAQSILNAINKKDMGLEEIQGLNFYVMQRSRYDYIVENSFLYAEKDLREEKDPEKIKQAREILNILSKDNQSPEEIIKLNVYLNQKELYGTVAIVKDLIQNETNEFNKTYIQNILDKLEKNTPLTIIDLNSLRSYYIDKIKDIILVDGLKLLENRKDDWAKSTAEKVKSSVLSPYEVQEIYSLVKNAKKLEEKQKILATEKQQDKEEKGLKEEVLSLIETLTHKANEIQDEQKIDQILHAIEQAEEKLQKVQSLSEKLQKTEYKKLIISLKTLL